MEVPDYLQQHAGEILTHELVVVSLQRDYWEMRIAHEKLEHELRCQKLRTNEQGVQIQ